MQQSGSGAEAQAAKAWHRKNNQQNLRNMQCHIQPKHSYDQVLFQ